MEDNSGDKTRNVHTDQSEQNVQPPPPLNTIQQPVQSDQTMPTGLEHSFTDQQLGNVVQGERIKPKTGNKFIFILIIILIVCALVGLIVIASQKYLSLKDTQATKESTLTNISTVVPTKTESETGKSDIECDNFPVLLESCTKNVCQFTHPITGEEMTREIKGISNDICSYSEQMPNGGKMDCEYTEEMRIAVAKYQKYLENSKTVGTEISANLNPEGAEVNTTYTIDGKVVDNPLQEALDTGQCVVSGY